MRNNLRSGDDGYTQYSGQPDRPSSSTPGHPRSSSSRQPDSNGAGQSDSADESEPSGQSARLHASVSSQSQANEEDRLTPMGSVIGAIRVLIGLGLATAVGTQIVDRAVNGEFDAWKYFSFVTTQTTLFNVGILIIGGISALKGTSDSKFLAIARTAALTYAIMTSSVYNLLLRDDGAPAANEFVPIGWPSEAMHVWVPIYLVLDWLLMPSRPSPSWRSLPIIPIYAIAWALYTFARAAASGGKIYPYPFLDPATNGWGSVLAYIVGLTTGLVALGALAITYSRSAERR